MIQCHSLEPEPGVTITGVMMHMYMGGWKIGSDWPGPCRLEGSHRQQLACRRHHRLPSRARTLLPLRPARVARGQCKVHLWRRISIFVMERVAAHTFPLDGPASVTLPHSFKVKSLHLLCCCYDLSSTPTTHYSTRQSS